MDGAMDDATVAMVEDDSTFVAIVWLCLLTLPLLFFDDFETRCGPIPWELLEAVASARVGMMATELVGMA